MTDKYEARKAICLDDTDRAYGARSPGGTPVLAVGCYRGNAPQEGGLALVTGKAAESGCYAGVGRSR
jgi:hypothetical protein